MIYPRCHAMKLEMHRFNDQPKYVKQQQLHNTRRTVTRQSEMHYIYYMLDPEHGITMRLAKRSTTGKRAWREGRRTIRTSGTDQPR